MKPLLHTLFFFLLTTQICFAQWVQVGLNDKSIKDIAVKDATIFAVTSDSGKVYLSIDNGTNWTMIVDSNAIDVEISSTGKVFMTQDSIPPPYYRTHLFSSVDNGNTWIKEDIIEQIKDSLQYWWYCRPINITVSPTGTIFCQITGRTRPYGANYDVLAKSIDDGLFWTTPGMGVTGGKLFDFKDQFVLTLGFCVGSWISLSSDFGTTWTFLGWPPYENSPYLALGFFPNGNIIIGGNEFLLLSSDMCSTWTTIASIKTQAGLSWSNGSSEGMLIGSDIGVFLFSDDGDSLGLRNEGLTNLNVQALTLDNNGYVYAGTENGVWRRPLSEVTSVEEQEIDEIPTEFLLSNNYPNPFNPSTKIKFSVPNYSQVVIKVFDVLGNEIETLMDEEKPTGTYEVTWYAADLPSGVYFYQLKAGEYTAVKKMILLK